MWRETQGEFVCFCCPIGGFQFSQMDLGTTSYGGFQSTIHNQIQPRKISLTVKKMALILNPSSSFSHNKPNLHFHNRFHLQPAKILIKCQKDSSTEETTSEPGQLSRAPGDSPAGSGFGSSAAAASAKKKKAKGKRERASIVRRTPLEKPSLATRQEAARAEEQRKNENAFLLAWLGLGAIILIEGIALAASGFLPESWDKFFVKYLYPSFTPTVFLFIAGTVGYGVLKYQQNENSDKEN